MFTRKPRLQLENLRSTVQKDFYTQSAKSRHRVKADRDKVTQSVRLLATHRDAMAVTPVRIIVP